MTALDDLIEDELYALSRERLREFYGDKVDTFDDGDLDEYEGMLDDFVERYGEPLHPLEFLKYAADEFARQHKVLQSLLRSHGLDQ